MPQWLWFKVIEEEGKTVALGSRCRAAGHRLRSRRGHCVQCDTSKLGYQARYGADQYVYVAGSHSAKLVKIGTCKNCEQRENQLRTERYGGAGDWDIVFTVYVKNAGAIEDAARSRLSRYIVARTYWKNGNAQSGIELLKCPFSKAMNALIAAAEGSLLSQPWKVRHASNYEFAYEE
jgi:hypothetical protein